jgi:hypothetical protein
VAAETPGTRGTWESEFPEFKELVRNVEEIGMMGNLEFRNSIGILPKILGGIWHRGENVGQEC